MYHLIVRVIDCLFTAVGLSRSDTTSIRWLHAQPLGMSLTMLLLVGTVVGSPEVGWAQDADERFKNFEIRVIRPKYFTKSSAFELGIQIGAIVNDPFLYTFHSHLNLTYHLTEGLGFELSGAYGLSLDRVEKTVLEDKFSIRPNLYRPQHFGGGALVWTPVYGKFQISGNRLAYFDFFILAGGGVTGIQYRLNDCGINTVTAAQKATQSPPTSKVSNYMTGQVGGGQKIFLNKKSALRWDFISQIFPANSSDSICASTSGKASASQSREIKMSILIKLGFSRFF